MSGRIYQPPSVLPQGISEDSVIPESYFGWNLLASDAQGRVSSLKVTKSCPHVHWHRSPSEGLVFRSVQTFWDEYYTAI